MMFDKAKVVKTDIPCKNGVIHVIDSGDPAKSKDLVRRHRRNETPVML